MATLGQILRKKREAKQLSIKQIADKTSVRHTVLTAIENDDYRSIEAPYLRSFIKQFAKAVDLPESEAMQLLTSQQPKKESVLDEVVHSTQKAIRDGITKAENLSRTGSRKIKDTSTPSPKVENQPSQMNQTSSQSKSNNEQKAKKVVFDEESSAASHDTSSLISGTYKAEDVEVGVNSHPLHLQTRHNETMRDEEGFVISKGNVEDEPRPNIPVATFENSPKPRKIQLPMSSRIPPRLINYIVSGAIALAFGSFLYYYQSGKKNSNAIPNTVIPIQEGSDVDTSHNESSTSTDSSSNSLSVQVPASSISEQDSLILEAVALERAWLNIICDGQRNYQLTLDSGSTIRWSAANKFVLSLGNAGGIQFTLNGKPMKQIGARGTVVRNFQISRSRIISSNLSIVEKHEVPKKKSQTQENTKEKPKDKSKEKGNNNRNR